jgi:hypothetical protein
MRSLIFCDCSIFLVDLANLVVCIAVIVHLLNLKHKHPLPRSAGRFKNANGFFDTP